MGKLRFEDEPLSLDIAELIILKPKRRVKKKLKARHKPSYMDKFESANPDDSGSKAQSTVETDIHDDLSTVSGDDDSPNKKSKLQFKKDDSNSAFSDNSNEADSRQPDGKLKFGKNEGGDKESDGGQSSNRSDSGSKSSKIAKLEKRAEYYSKKLEQTRSKLPTKKARQKQRVYDEVNSKVKTKLTFEEEIVPINEAKWNQPKKRSPSGRVINKAGSMAATKVHAKIHQAESQNVGVEATHKAELLGESAYRGTKRATQSGYRYYKNRHYRRASRLEVKSIKSRIKLDYEKAVQDIPGLASGRSSKLKHGASTKSNPVKDGEKAKKNPISRYFQKRAIKRNYAKQLRAAKASGKTAKFGVGMTQRVTKLVTNIVRKNPIFMLKAALLVLVMFMLMSLITMCGMMISNSSAVIAIASYLAEDTAIDNAALSYSESIGL